MSFLDGGFSSVDPFSFGFGPDLGGLTPAPGNGTPAKTNTVVTQPWYATLFSGANGILNSVLAYNVQQNQVNHGQNPSVQAPGGVQALGFSTANLSSLVPLLVIVAIILVVFKLASGGRR